MKKIVPLVIVVVILIVILIGALVLLLQMPQEKVIAPGHDQNKPVTPGLDANNSIPKQTITGTGLTSDDLTVVRITDLGITNDEQIPVEPK